MFRTLNIQGKVIQTHTPNTQQATTLVMGAMKDMANHNT